MSKSFSEAGGRQALIQSNLDIVLLISGACNLGAQIKDLNTYVWKKNLNYL